MYTHTHTHTHTHIHTHTHTRMYIYKHVCDSEEPVFDGAYVHYIGDNKISLYDKVSHQRQNASNMWSYGLGERQIYRFVYLDTKILTISDREL